MRRQEQVATSRELSRADTPEHFSAAEEHPRSGLFANEAQTMAPAGLTEVIPSLKDTLLLCRRSFAADVTVLLYGSLLDRVLYRFVVQL